MLQHTVCSEAHLQRNSCPTIVMSGSVQTAISTAYRELVWLHLPATSDRALPDVLRAHVDRVLVAPTQTIAFETDENVGTAAPNVALACFRIVQEGVANAVKHSKPTNLQVGLKRVNDNVMVSRRRRSGV
jgi:signal transduction histidine kinase